MGQPSRCRADGKGSKFQVKMNTGKRWGWERLRESWDRVVE